jgi:cytochrome c-type biogenesis protein CcmH
LWYPYRNDLGEQFSLMMHIFQLKRVFLFLLLMGTLTLITSVGAAQGNLPSDDEVNRIASQLYCPICDNMALDVCPLAACRDWRELIREQLAEGWTEQEIKDYFVTQYGDRVLGEPPRSGLNWILYLAPPVIILLGLILLISKAKRPARTNAPLTRDPEHSSFHQVERDLEDLE